MVAILRNFPIGERPPDSVHVVLQSLRCSAGAEYGTQDYPWFQDDLIF